MHADNQDRYGSVSRFLQWSMALCLLFMFASALLWQWDEAWRRLLPWHKGGGMLLLMLAAFRILWAISVDKRPAAANIAVRLGHSALYVFMIAVPTAALIREAAANASADNWGMRFGDIWHGRLAYAFLLLIVGHIFMAFYHQWRGEKLLQRMIG